MLSLLLIGGLLHSPPALAEVPSRVDVEPLAVPAVDVPLTFVTAVGWYALFRQHDDWADPSCPCDRTDAPRWDRIGVDGTWRQGETMADATLGAALLVSLGAAAMGADDMDDVFEDALLSTEAMMIAGLLTQGVKTATSRPYPYLLRPGADPAREADGVNYAAFWSGHTATPMAAAVAAAWQFQRRRPHDPMRWVFWVVGPALALSSGVFQISAGNHYPSDVVVGAAVGAGVGLAVPWLHGEF
ncbi:MAG: phosphatase PAP2 family protein [Bradymonadia bacterium]